ncbi:apolipoprotein N-acyltransferase [Rhodohalobacter sulfatireducens]|uniref:Apolipoprotein N-acyltransferase n=1 Tax=Rhodohalobacter sulfatireducens TaxID=2911366 RepID=A0ABS9KBE5_9BACT|nr:apolipoprotein N-acyltransferase [Rhodohalobacter sulfatireducens]MCG2588174.1 apolipoprotein N-acyltransferase [Rhodohalobacter sulfatireducens]
MNQLSEEFNQNTRIWDRPWVLSISASVLLSLSFPPFNAAILQIPAFLCLFRIASISETKREVILYAYPSFVLWNLLTTYWLMMATIAGGIAAILANAALMLIPLLLIRRFQNSNLNPILSSFIAAATWVGYEFLHHNWDLSWPWLTLGNAWSNLTGVIQYISYTGVLGISFWVVFTSALFYTYIKSNNRKLLITSVSVLLLFPLFSMLSLLTMEYADEEKIEVTIVQPNSDSYQRYGGEASLDALLNKLLRLSNEAKTEETDVIIWPENAVDSSLRVTSPQFDVIKDSLQAWNTSLITGLGLIEIYEESDEKPEIVRESTGGSFYNIYNAALHLKPNQPTKIYRKGRLVPIVERFPFVTYFQRLDLFKWVDWATLAGYGLGQEPTLFPVNENQTPALICYDSVFPGWVNQFAQEGAGFLTIITNDGWWGDSAGHVQHFAYARLRAIEQRMWIARSANNGISGIISPDGKVQLQTEYWTEDAFSFTIYNSNHQTFYNKFGDWLGYFSLISFVLGLIGVRLRE